jgi:hypothetical protein
LMSGASGSHQRCVHTASSRCPLALCRSSAMSATSPYPRTSRQKGSAAARAGRQVRPCLGPCWGPAVQPPSAGSRQGAATPPIAAAHSTLSPAAPRCSRRIPRQHAQHATHPRGCPANRSPCPPRLPAAPTPTRPAPGPRCPRPVCSCAACAGWRSRAAAARPPGPAPAAACPRCPREARGTCPR